MDRSRPMTGLPVVGQQQLRAAIPSAMRMNPMMRPMMGMARPIMGAPIQMMAQRPNFPGQPY